MDLLTLYFFLYVMSISCLLIAMFAPEKVPRLGLMALGLAFAIAVPFIQTLEKL